MRALLLIAVLVAGCGKSTSEKRLDKRRAIAADYEDVVRRTGAPTRVSLRGKDETVMVIVNWVDGNGVDGCSQQRLDQLRVFKPKAGGSATPDWADPAKYIEAGMTRVECETKAGRVVGVDLK
jgi:hypothetical protein